MLTFYEHITEHVNWELGIVASEEAYIEVPARNMISAKHWWVISQKQWGGFDIEIPARNVINHWWVISQSNGGFFHVIAAYKTRSSTRFDLFALCLSSLDCEVTSKYLEALKG